MSDEELVERLMRDVPKVYRELAEAVVAMYRTLQRIERDEAPDWHDPLA